MNATNYRGHRPRLVDSVTKRMACVDCGCSWDRGRTPPGPCPGPANAQQMPSKCTPILGTKTELRGGLYRGKCKPGS